MRDYADIKEAWQQQWTNILFESMYQNSYLSSKARWADIAIPSGNLAAASISMPVQESEKADAAAIVGSAIHSHCINAAQFSGSCGAVGRSQLLYQWWSQDTFFSTAHLNHSVSQPELPQLVVTVWSHDDVMIRSHLTCSSSRISNTVHLSCIFRGSLYCEVVSSSITGNHPIVPTIPLSTARSSWLYTSS
jgi:hypothetical protein